MRVLKPNLENPDTIHFNMFSSSVLSTLLLAGSVFAGPIASRPRESPSLISTYVRLNIHTSVMQVIL
jgi:hypothetical protein